MSDPPAPGRVPHAPVHVHLQGEPFTGAALRVAGELAGETVASRLGEGDPSVWGPVDDARRDAGGREGTDGGHGGDAGPVVGRDRLGWVPLPRHSRPLAAATTAGR